MRRALHALLSMLLSSAVMVPVFARAQGTSGADQDIPEAASLVHAGSDALELPTGGHGSAGVRLQIQAGWHINANPPALDYMIATEVRLPGVTGIRVGRPLYPLPRKVKLAFEDSEMLVYDGEAMVQVPVAIAPQTAPGRYVLEGTVRFQACNDQVCLAPAAVPFQLAVNVTPGAGGDAGGAPDTTAPGGVGDPGQGAAPDSTWGPAGFKPGGAMSIQQRLEAALAVGGLGWWLALFVGGLLLNLTPCVFPMLGVTVSIFGARRQEPLPRVLTAAVLYVLGIAVMYSVLGVIAALTGGLFGAALQSAWVSAGLGALLVVLSLSMFGLYEMQPPAWLLMRMGGANTTSALGLFLSGLAVGVIAAPCIGPFVVAVLALIAQRGNPLFGFQTMFALSLGLGFPYLFLATFSNLLQKLPRSGEWMVWVKKVFGVILAALGIFYLVVGLDPALAMWVLPAALIVGGIWLGFLQRVGADKPGFRTLRMATGVVGVVAGIAVIASAPRARVAFEPYDPKALAAGLAQGRVALLDFSAEWCAPCHELDNLTFTDGRVILKARSFLAYKADLTADSEETRQLRRQYRISGVPTLVFLAPDGHEIEQARVEGYIPVEPLLDLMHGALEHAGKPVPGR